MFHLIILGLSGLFILLYFLCFRKVTTDSKILKVLGILLFIAHCATLYYSWEIDKASALEGIFKPFGLIMMMILKWFTSIAVGVGIFSMWFKTRTLEKISKTLILLVAIFNLIFFNDILAALHGYEINYWARYPTYGFIFQTAFLIMIGFVWTLNMIKDKDFKFTKEEVKNFVLVILALMVAFFPQGALQVFFGPYGGLTKDFNLIHRICLYANVAFFAISLFGMKGQPLDVKRAFLVIASFSGFSQYFYEQRLGYAGLPLHLCNTAVILVFVAYVFKFNGLFYFSFFVNVLGAFFATVLPEVSHDAFNHVSVHYWYNHIHALVTPLLGIGLGVYKRPNMKMMYKAIGVFTAYFILVIFLNAWFNNYQSVDYFFTYGDFFTSKLAALVPIKNGFVFKFAIGDLTFKFYWLIQLMIYVGFIGLMFITWLLYDYAFSISDEFKKVMFVRDESYRQLNELKKIMNGRELSEPLDEEFSNMIKIEHFTKRYSGSNKLSVDDFNLVINDGEVFGFLGHNGAGKSTTIKSMVGIQTITHGNIIIDGYDIAKQPLEAKLRIGYVSDNHAVYEKLTGREYINYVADLYLVSKEDRDARIEKYTKMFNLVEAIDREIKGYSHGMKQKLVVIASLIHNPKVWILDEPLTGLDPTSAFQIKECMREHANNGNIVFFSSHVIEVVEKVCDRICIIQKGKLVGIYDLKKIAEEGVTLEELYMKHVVQANYNISAPEAIKEFENRKSNN